MLADLILKWLKRSKSRSSVLISRFNAPRYFDMLKTTQPLTLAKACSRAVTLLDLIIERPPVSISLGLWSTLIIYVISLIPLGIMKAIHHGSRFDIWSSAVVIVGYAVPAGLRLSLIILFASGNYFSWFPLRVWYRVTLISLIGISKLATTLALSVAYFCDGHRRLCHIEHADQKLLPLGWNQ